MKIHEDIMQGSLEWGMLRAGKVTASEMDALVSPLGKVRTGDGPRSYLMKKIAEAWTGGPLPASQGIWELEQGQILEDYAKPAFALETGLEVRNVGFITGDDERIGCSPDGLIGSDSGLEIKCPHIDTHIRYLLDGVLPANYVLQVQGSLYVTGFKKWTFCSYRRRLPLFILDIEPEDKIQAAIHSALEIFMEQFDAAMKRLTKINGGPPRRKTDAIPRQEPVESFDLIL